MSVFEINPPFSDYEGWLLEEDRALKTLLQGVTVTDINAPKAKPREVKVWYRMPQMELRTVTYPYIVIDFMGQRVASEREHRATQVKYGTEPNTANPVDPPLVGGFPIPIDLDYQVTAGSRDAQHDRQIISQMMAPNRLHPRFASLTCASGTVRRLDVMQMAMNGDGVDKDAKRFFRKIWTIRVSSELVPEVVSTSRVAKGILTAKDKATGVTFFTRSIP